MTKLRSSSDILECIAQRCANDFREVDGVNETAGYDEGSIIIELPSGTQYVVIVRQLDDEEYVGEEEMQ